MKQIKIGLVATTAFILMAFTTLKTFNADPAHSEVGFSITHLGISDVTGTFRDFKATINSEKEDFSDAVVEATVNVASIDTRVEARNEHLKSADFFDVAKYPEMTFKSTALKKAGTNKYKITGNLTIKGITKPVTLDLTYRGSAENPASKKTASGFKLSGMIKRTDFGIGSGFPSPVLSDEVAININAEFSHQ